jgi:hypothetical protein
MIDAHFVPIESWPSPPTRSRQYSRFRSPYVKTLDLLEDELKKLRAKNIVIESFFTRSQLRNDGWPFSKESPSQPGVIVSFTGKSGEELAFPCDRYSDWQDNLHAIALALGALRAVDRYGVTQRAEQYKGWAKLPPAPDKMTVKDALAFIQIQTGIEAVTPDKLREAYRSAARKLHPDVSGTDHQFILLGRAREAIEEAYGWGKTA